ncbi:DUF3068 domain-containing protein [Corynebacterium gerontici]|uniref:DUF3068 domain-containing protein n=1 Tax=Corynebacterium gerontici TaxID=2079234 RepID=A0A3G6J289_9CORY|nr:DUF3068 domain-containing protein [Corynebacterium gerontici]AZA12175.1 hypothetical protein CGERO_09420 [Corynebacterium gerontici]
MLPKSRITSALAIGFGLFLVVVGLLAPALLDKGTQLPMGFEHTTYTLRDDQARSRVIGRDREVQAPVTRQLHYELFPAADDEHATVQVGLTQMRESMQDEVDRLITASVWSTTIDRTSGELSQPLTVTDQLGNPPREVQADGIWLKFPAHAEQTTYSVLDPELREAVPAEFTESEEKDGHTLNHYVQTIEPKNVALNYAAVKNTVTVPRGEKQVTAYLYHSGKREFVVDQRTGLVVNVIENIDDYYALNNGERVADGLVFNGALSDEDQAALLDATSEFPDWRVPRIICWVLAAIGGVITLVGIFGAFGTGNNSGKSDQDGDPEVLDSPPTVVAPTVGSQAADAHPVVVRDESEPTTGPIQAPSNRFQAVPPVQMPRKLPWEKTEDQ